MTAQKKPFPNYHLLDSPFNNEDYPLDKPEEACGVFGVLAPEREVAKLTYFGLYALQHRGQESAGIATLDKNSIQLTYSRKPSSIRCDFPS